MQYRRLGANGPSVPAIGLGFWSIGGAFGGGDSSESSRTIAHAIDAGATLFDTAPAYGDSETFLGDILTPEQQKRVYLTTKCGLAPDSKTGRLQLDSRPEALRSHIEGSLRRLRRDNVDLLLIHWPDPRVPIEEAIGGLDALRREGLAGAIGVSNFSAAQLRQACSVAPIACNQVSYHIFDRRWEAEMFDTAAELGVAVVAYSPLAHGLLSGSLDPASFGPGDWRAHGDTLSSQRLFAPENLEHNLALARRMAQLAVDQKLTMPQAAIAWILAHPQVASVITGSRRVTRLQENLSALDVTLDPETRAMLTSLGDSAAGLQDDIPVWPIA